MRPRHKITWLALVLVVAIIGALWFQASRTPPQIITLSDGRQFRFAGATYGTNHIQPRLLSQIVCRLPLRLANYLREKLQPRFGDIISIHTEAPAVCVWFVQLGINQPPAGGDVFATMRLANQAGLEAGPSYAFSGFGSGTGWSAFPFEVVPKRSRTLQLIIQPRASTGGRLPVIHFSFPNPVYGRFPQWQPDPVPDVKQAGDLEVRLNRFEAGAVATKDGTIVLSRFDVSLAPKAGENADWRLLHLELSDATGNVLREERPNPVYAIPDLRGPTNFTETIGGMLWPDENARWLKLEFARAWGFASNELLTFKNVPIPKIGTTNTLNLRKNAGGVQVLLTDFSRQSNTPSSALLSMYPASQIGVDLPGHPAGVALDLLEVTTDAGKTQDMYIYHLEQQPWLTFSSIPTNATTMDLTFVLQKTRTVEFLVQPPQNSSSK